MTIPIQSIVSIVADPKKKGVVMAVVGDGDDVHRFHRRRDEDFLCRTDF